MTQSSLGALAVYPGNDTTGPFPLIDLDGNLIFFLVNADIEVRVYSDDYTFTTLTDEVDYTLTGASFGGIGDVTLTTALTTGYTLAIARREALTQTLDLQFGGSLSIDDLEDVLDKQTRLLQELREQINRSPIFSRAQVAAAATSRIMPAPVAGGVWSYSDDLQVEFVPISLMRFGTATPTTDVGNTGDFYFDYDDGLLYGPKAGGEWGSGISTTGPKGDTGDQGDQGIPGQTILSGSGAPSNGLGNDGDFYIDTSVYDIYGPKAAGAWGGGFSLVGPLGAGNGDVNGPASATDNAVTRFNSTTGKLIQDSVVTISDTGTIAGAFFASTGLKIGDSDGSNVLTIGVSADLSENIALLIASDSTQTLDMGGNLVVTANSAIGGTAYVAGGTDVAIADGGTGQSTAAAAFSALAQPATTVAIGAVAVATDAQVRAATADINYRMISSASIESASAAVTLTDAGTVTLDWDSGINFTLTMAGNRTLDTPTNAQPGTWRTIRVNSNSSSARALAFHGNYRGAGNTTLTGITNTQEYLLSLFAITSSICIVGVMDANNS